MTIYSGFSHKKWGFSIAMLVYQRVDIFEGMPECLTTSFEAVQPLASLRSIKMPKASAMDWNLRVRPNSGGFGKLLKVKLGDLTFYWKDF